MKAYKFRFYPTKKQEELLRHHLWVSKNLWNELLEANKKRYEEEKKFYSKTEMQLMVKDTELYSQTAQAVSHRLNNAISRKIKSKGRGDKYGFPRFKPFDRMKSLSYPQSGFSLGGMKLKVTPFGEIFIKRHREISGIIKTLTLKREASGKWFACFSVLEEKRPPKENNGEKVGVDLGLEKFAALSDGKIIANPRHFKKHEKRLALKQKRLSRCGKGSKNRRKSKRKVAVEHERISNCRSDFLHKLSHELVNSYSLLALEKLSSKHMAEQNFGKPIHDAGWNMFANMICYKAEEAGCKVVFVDPEDTTKECSRCGKIVEKTLSDRIHDCPFCGLSIDRDVNAARNILARGTAGTAGTNASGDETRVSSMMEEAHPFRGG
jgi:putative transposase